MGERMSLLHLLLEKMAVIPRNAVARTRKIPTSSIALALSVVAAIWIPIIVSRRSIEHPKKRQANFS